MSESAPYQHGEIVDITIRGARVDTCSHRGLFVTIPGADHSISLPTDTDGMPVDAIDVTVTQPADGPARPGDIWRNASGVRWFAYKELQFGDPVLRLTSGELRDYTLTGICEVFGAPVLEYRVPEPVAAEPEPVAGKDFLTDAQAAEPNPRRRVDVDGDEWHECADDGWVIWENGGPGSIWKPDLDTLHDDYGPLTDPDEQTAQVPA